MSKIRVRYFSSVERKAKLGLTKVMGMREIMLLSVILEERLARNVSPEAGTSFRLATGSLREEAACM